jgi:hypothetical protein
VLEFLNQQDGVDVINSKLKINGPADVPNREFHGPF